MKAFGGRWIGVGLAVLVLIVDQVTKWWVINEVMNPPRVIPVTPFFNLVMGWNRGISFGLMNRESAFNAWVLPLVAVVIVVILSVWLWRNERTIVAIAIGLVIGGALGNVVDRLRYGAVADFLDFHAAGIHWPAFNVADTSITVGAAILVLESLFARRESPKNGSGTSDMTDN
jgi:signal peptidase II